MHGGASQIDTFDPKPGRETGGEFSAIPTSLAGVRVAEHLPRLARRMHKLALIRSLTAVEGNHDRARYLMHAGYAPAGGVDHPAFGSIVASSRDPGTLPGYVSIGGPGHDAGLLGAQHAPFVVGDPTRPVRNLEPARGISRGRLDARLALWRAQEQRFAAGRGGAQVAGHPAVVEQAVTMMRAPESSAFDLEREPQASRARYGDTGFAQGCLMARRLVESGVPFVEVSLRGWDTHENNFDRVRALSGELDAGMSALLDDLEARGLLDSTLVLWAGDFGRTPRINARGGRDHFPRCSSVALAGGGVRGGQVIGATDADGSEIAERPVTVPDLFRSLAHALAVNPDETFVSAAGRPITAVDGGAVVEELF
ncbi:MAG: DUF1501 domain-containing protein [Myxococcales bacterium]|nr:DUF1501 domain-containing protein [Myxococcales bacterium]